MKIDTNAESNRQLLDKIRLGDRQFLQKLYQEHRQEFSSWLRKYRSCDQDLEADIYQRAFITLYYNVKEGKLTDLTSSLKTYLFAIARNLLRDHYKLSIRRQEIMEVAIDKSIIDNEIMDRYETSGLQDVVKELLEQIGEPCKTVLELFYLKGYALESIALEMNYKSEQVAAKRKFICLRQMRNLLQTARQRGDL
ncbi:MAG: hypothetical protein DHS20C17_08860 [Cyclobacteriaceae bacterium]|nr:MAG: hypothetical protein DHS20C17_08860 [Cyclobacteriaceae bacterium]